MTSVSNPVPNRRAILLRAARIIEERGFARGGKAMPFRQRHYHMPENAPVCILGAIEAALEMKSGEKYGDEAYALAAEVIDPARHTSVGSYWSWNDDVAAHTSNPTQRVATTLRRLAKGIPWMQAKESRL